MEIKMLFRDSADKDWSEHMKAKPGDTIQCLIERKGISQGSVLRADLPAGTHYVEGSTRFKDPIYPNQVRPEEMGISGDVTKGIDIVRVSAPEEAAIIL